MSDATNERPEPPRQPQQICELVPVGEVARLKVDNTTLKARLAEVEGELSVHKKDLEDAAGELLVDIPHPDSVIAKLLRANRIMRGQRDDAKQQLATAKLAADMPDTFTGTLAEFIEHDNFEDAERFKALSLAKEAAAQRVKELEGERNLMAKLAKCQDSPQFYNPLEATAAMVLRDKILAAARATKAPAAGELNSPVEDGNLDQDGRVIDNSSDP